MAMNAIIKPTAIAMATSTLMVFSSYAAQVAELDSYFQDNIWKLTLEGNLSVQDPYFSLSYFRYVNAGMEDPYFLLNGYPNFHYHENEQKTVYGVTYTQNNVSLGNGNVLHLFEPWGIIFPRRCTGLVQVRPFLTRILLHRIPLLRLFSPMENIVVMLVFM